MTVPRWWWVWFSVRLGVKAGIISGVIVGLIAGLGGWAFTSTLPDLTTYAVGGFWLVLLGLPLVYGLNLALLVATAGARGPVWAWIVPMTALAWLPAYGSCFVSFMIPVLVVPIVANRGVNFDTSAQWYDQVETALLNGPVAP